MSSFNGYVAKVKSIVLDESKIDDLPLGLVTRLREHQTDECSNLNNTFKCVFGVTESDAIDNLKVEVKEHYSRFLPIEAMKSIQFTYDLSEVKDNRFWESSGLLSKRIHII